MSKVRQREKQKARRARHDHGLREEATAASRPRRRMARAVVGVIGVLGILFLGVLGSLVRQETDQDQAATSASSVPVITEPDAALPPPPPPPCPAADGSSPRRTLFDAAPAMCIDPSVDYQARFVTSSGAFVADLDQERSPLAVNNFVFLSRYHFYDELAFPTVISGSYAQTGDPVAPDQVGPGYTYPDDPLPPPGTYEVGSLVVAHERPDDNGSQFLILLGEQGTELPHVFPQFGRVIQGLDVLAEISSVGGTAADPSPDDPPTIERIDIIEAP